MGRLGTRLTLLPRAALNSLARRRRPAEVRSVLIAHHLLLGDTLMLTALLARCRRRWPTARIVMTVAPGLEKLYASRPYDVTAMPFDPHRAATARRIAQSGPYDLALVPGDNRHTMLAHAAGARWVVALDDVRVRVGNMMADELVPWPELPTALADIFASLAGSGEEAYDRAAWPSPAFTPVDLPRIPYSVLHVGAGSPLRHWPAERWMDVAESLVAQGFPPIWSGGASEAGLIEAIDPQHRFPSTAGKLDLPQLWRLLEYASLLVVPDTGIAHLAKLTGTPTVCLFGPGSDVLFGAGTFWRHHRFVPVIEADFPCRDQRTLFKRELDWVRRCQRGTNACAAPACMHALTAERVIAACQHALSPDLLPSEQLTSKQTNEGPTTS